MKQSLRYMVLLSLPLLGNCGGSGEGLDQNGRPGAGNGPALTADLQSIQANVFTPICTACHTGAAAPLGFRLDAASAFAMLVNAPSVEVPTLRRVAPGQPDSSYLIQKLEGHAAVGGQMPLNQAPLPQATIDVIRQWIANGAPAGTATAAMAVTSPASSAQATTTTEAPSVATMQAPTAASATTTATAAAPANISGKPGGSAAPSVPAAPTPLQLIAITPLEDEILTRSAGEPIIAASGNMDLSSLNTTNLVVERSTDGTFSNATTTVVQGAKVEVRSAKPTVLAILIPPSQRLPGSYRVRIQGDGPAPAVDATGQPVGNFALQFTIEDAP